MPFRGCVCTLQRLLLEPSRCRIRQCLLAGITVPVAFAPFSHPSPAPCFTFSPSLLLFWNPLTRPFTAFGLLGTKQSLTVTQSTRNPSRNPAAKAVSSGNRICGNGCLCTPLLTLPLIPDTLKSPFLCTLSMTKTPEASQLSLFLYFLLSLANCWNSVRCVTSEPGLCWGGFASPCSSWRKKTQAWEKSGSCQCRDSAKGSHYQVSNFGGKKGAEEKKKKAWRTLVLLGKPGELLEGGEDFEAIGCSVK